MVTQLPKLLRSLALKAPFTGLALAATGAGNAAEHLRDANPQHTELVVIPGAGHEWFTPGRPEVMQRVLAWFDAHV